MKLDIATVLGFVVGFGMVLMGVFEATGGDPVLAVHLYINQVASIAIAVGGAVGATLISAPLDRMKRLITLMRKSFVEDEKNSNYVDLIKELVEYATEARRNGVLALDARTEEIKDPFIKSAIQLAVDGTAPETISDILSQERDAMAKRHEENQAVLLKLGEMGPSFGLLGTVIGLIAMLANMSDPSSIGPAMAVALVATLYGSVVANLVALPVATKLAARTAEEVHRKQMIIDAVLSIQNGDNPRVIQQKLLTYVSPKVREQVLATQST